ncbi:creatininase family protein [Camelliibacillus cellulosilyticus]|uniref:Creatininase family protein n=1 Tax=Camelliibacillus cellulosilyticus TaxID=2174486 RepID=A0ABV9GPB1_9BACL
MFYEHENAGDFKATVKKAKKTVLLPVGAVEAHGPHLPLGTDNLLAERLAERVAQETGALQLPTLSYGQVWSLRHFPGSINISNSTLIQMIVDIGKSLYFQGFRIFAMVNGHLGNNVALKEAARELYDLYPEMKVYYFFYPGTKDIINEVRETPAAHASYFHACELETSYMLYLAEEYVDMDKAINDPPTITEEADLTPTPWEEITHSAVLGDATLATKEKGKRVVDQAVQSMAAILKGVQEKQNDQSNR